LILTKNDYRFYESHRKPLFRRLRSDLLSRTFVFVGYSLADNKYKVYKVIARMTYYIDGATRPTWRVPL
jgi:hypothetical protein